MSEQSTKPFDRSYWVVPGRFLAGYFPGDKDRAAAEAKLRRLLDCGIRCIINLMREYELDDDGLPFAPYDGEFRRLAAERGVAVTCLRMPIRDLHIPTRETMRQILDAVDECIAAGRPVYVHCWGGVGRTGTVVGCWLARHGLATGDAVLTRIDQLRQGDVGRRARPSPETEVQRQFVRSWQPRE
ncbi:MAG TPA: protein phosphatase [Anaerolineae bacterium]|nr:protein phosphatase [Anaerolineae bacterium]HOQ99352.1 protein phosphatase [Anaerolineae bacterium]HPL26789.1 protein phosphatase [Anaerolineae bacterium]